MITEPVIPRVSFGLFLTMTVGLAGLNCSPQLRSPQTVPVSGTVLVKGKPLAGVRITFHPVTEAAATPFTPAGLTGPDGRFTLSTARPGDGAPPGEYKVTFELLQVSHDALGRETEVDLWRGKYARLESAPTVVITPQGGQLEPFRLE
ncbi:MAG: hypothetical protein NZ703_10300 [Gemmataceae bacterium]|nr:hypothetical protein [Gemmataceae bacterium]MDW8244822.1 hypothetical protein [Thermogemmata sp.]